ncbi:VOC family protein [Clostridium chromiireducens]|uniref:VOC family protein n=1 Tax=Clostridium chromiireducens TaxID=225345 RepID=A0A964RII6_9CLOT|nr:VOC family protein [Clostridium chromiireducens]MVX62324.1 VOC family protein [Clostridium chromiireducens]
MGIKSMHHVCIQTSNYKESLEFYTKILGFEVVQETKDFHGRDFNTWLKLGEFMIELQTSKKEDTLIKWNKLNEGIVHMCFLVDDVNKELNRIKSLGYDNFKVKNNEIIYKVEDSFLFKLKAPEGTEVEIRDKSEI